MHDFTAWLHAVAHPFAMLTCPPSDAGLEWCWRIRADPMGIVDHERIFMDAQGYHTTNHQHVAHTAHQKLAITAQEPAVLAGFQAGLTQLAACVQTTTTMTYAFHFCADPAPARVSIALITPGGQNLMHTTPLTRPGSLDTFARAMKAHHQHAEAR